MDPDGSSTRVLLVAQDGTEHELGRVDARVPDGSLVDALLRMQLAACRRRMRLRVRGAGPRLRELLTLSGLDGVLVLDAEDGRQAEVPEVLRADEVVQRGDPAL